MEFRKAPKMAISGHIRSETALAAQKLAKHWLNKVDIVSYIWGGRLDPSGPIKNGPGGSQRAPKTAISASSMLNTG